MPDPQVENEHQYRAALDRIAALDAHLDALGCLRRLAAAHRALAHIEDEDLRDLAPVEDARTDVAFTRDRLRRATRAWEETVQYSHRPPELAPVVQTIRRQEKSLVGKRGFEPPAPTSRT